MRNKILKRVITVIFLLLHTLEIFGANLVVDPNSTYNTKIDESRNGVPIVNISTPNDRGVSINEFKEYNVDEKGQILNNADNIGRSYLGGLINANPNLAPNQAANLIILQVNGSNRSQIEGYLEALSRQKVDVILANENGLYINNSGTINIKNFTATTGKLNLKDGDFVGIDVEKGNVLIGPKGFNGNNTDYVDIIAKTLELRGNIVANNLNIKTGSNDKNSSNTLAIDASELGGMYAGVIKIVSTDKGVGVNSDSFIVSKDKKLEITADGQIKINKVQAKGIDIKGKEYIQKDLTYSDGDISIKADKIKLAGTGMSGNKVSLNGDVENSSNISAKENLNTKNFSNTGLVQVNDKIEVEGNLTNNGEILTNKNLTAKDAISTKKLIAKDGISVGKLENSGVVVTEKNLNINKNLINSGNVQAVGKISVVENTNNTGEILTNSSFTSKNTITTKKLIAKEGISVGKLENSGAVISNKKLNVDGSLTNSGNIQAIENITATNNVLNKGTILTNGSFTSKDIKNEKELSANKDISVSKLENTGNVVTNSKININGILTNTGELKALENITTTGNTTNNGRILTNKNFVTSDLINNQKIIAKEKIDVKNLKNTGTIASGDKITINGNLENTNNIETINLDVTGNKLINSGSIKADNITTNVANITNDGKILSFNNISFSNAQNIKNTDEIKALKDIEANNINLVNKGNIASNGKVSLNNSSITNTKKIASSTIEMQNNKKFDNTGEIVGNNVTLTTANDIDLVGKLHGTQSLTISGKNITNNGETTGTGTTSITASNNFTNNSKLAAQTLTVTATGDVVNNKMLSGGKVSLSGNNIQNNDLIAAADTLTLTAKNKVENKEGKTIYGGNLLSINGKEIINTKGEFLGGNINLTGNLVKNQVGLIQATNNITIKANKFENIGEVSDLDKYEKYYETWDGQIIEEKDIGDWKRSLGGNASKGSNGHAGDYIRGRQKEEYEKVASKMRNDKYKSILFPKYEKLMERHLGNKGDHTEKTGSAEIQEIPLKGKVRSLGETNHAKLIAGNNITIERNDGTTNEVLNKDAIISAGNIVKIDTNKLENIVSVGEKVKVKTGQETMFIKFKRPKRFGTVKMDVRYTRDFAPDIIRRKVPKLDKNGKIVRDEFGRKKYEYIEEYVGNYAYVTGQPSVIEGKAVDIVKADSLITQAIPEANGLINYDPKNRLKNTSVTINTGEGKQNSNISIGSTNSIDSLNGYSGKIEIVANTKKIEDIAKTGIIDVDFNLSSAMFTKNVNPSSKYILETRAPYINLSSFYGTDYFLSRVGYTGAWTRERRLGDAYYENQLITKNITEKLGSAFINGKSNTELVKSLIDNADGEAKRLGLKVGEKLTDEQVANLKEDIIWYVAKEVDGIKVLTPQVYLSQNTRNNLNTDGRNRIGGTEYTHIKTNDFVNDGTKIGNGGVTVVEANTITNRTLTNQLSEITGDKTYLKAIGNIKNIGSKIYGQEVASVISENGNILNETTTRKIEEYQNELSRTKFNEIASAGQISSEGVTYIEGNNYTSKAAITTGNKLIINAKNNVNIENIELTGEQKFGKDSNNYEAYGFKKNIGSDVKANDLQIKAKNLNIKGSDVYTNTANIDAKVNISSAIDYEDRESKSKEKGFLSSKSFFDKSHEESNSAGTLFVKNQGIITGDVNVVGSNLALGDNSYIAGKLTIDSAQLNSTHYHEESKKGFSASIGSSGFNVGYGKNQSTLKEKNLTNAKSNVVLGDGTVLNKGAEITATNLTHGNININNGDVKFGARKDTHDVESKTKSSGISLSIKIKSDALDRAKQGVEAVKQFNKDKIGGLATGVNTVTGVVSGLASNQGKSFTAEEFDAIHKSKDDAKDKFNSTNDKKEQLKPTERNNDFYAKVGASLGYNKSETVSKSHNETAVVTNIKGKENGSSITYNNVKNITYEGTQAQDNKFVYNNVENINKVAVELDNSSSTKSSSKGISAEASVGYGRKANAEFDAIKFSASGSKQNTDSTIHQNGSFVNVDEVHNNTKNMTLSGFNQVGGKVTGNIQNLTIESKQNESETSGSSYGASLGIAPNAVNGSVNYSNTDGERKYVDTPSSFVIGEGSNLKVDKAKNTAGIIGTTDNGKLKINEYVGKNLDNKDKLKTVGGSVGFNQSGISSFGVNYENKDLESTTKNTVIGNVEIGKSTGDEINRDIDTMTEVTKDKHFKTDISVESQTLNYIKNPDKFKEDLGKAKDEINDVAYAIEKSIKDPGEDNRNANEQLRETRFIGTFNNIAKEKLETLNTADEIADVTKMALADMGYDDVDVIFSDPAHAPQLIDKNGKAKSGTAYVDKETGRRTIIINANDPKNSDRAKLIGTLSEEASHIVNKIEGRQKKVPTEKGLESTGRASNTYQQDKYGENTTNISISSDGKDYSNVDFGENVGDKKIKDPRDFLKNEYGTEKEKKELEDLFSKEKGEKVYIDWDLYEGNFSEAMHYSLYERLKNQISKYSYRYKINYWGFEAKTRVNDTNEINKDFKEIDNSEAVYHNYIPEINSINMEKNKINTKRVNYYTGQESVTDFNEKLVTDTWNIGTGNTFTYDPNKKNWANTRDKIYHGLVDIPNWVFLGTGIADKSTAWQRLRLFIMGAKVSGNYKELTNKGYNTVGEKELKDFYNRKQAEIEERKIKNTNLR